MVYVLTGILVLCVGFFTASVRENKLITPATIVMSAYLIHAFVDVEIRKNISSGFDLSSWSTLTTFNILSFILIVVGYFFGTSHIYKKNKSYKKKAPPRINRLFGRNSFNIAVVIVLVTIIVQFFALWYWGKLSSRKDLFAYDEVSSYKIVSEAMYIVLTFLPALFLSLHCDGNKTNGKNFIVAILFGLVLLLSLAQFGRQAIFTLTLIIFLIYHFRIKKLNKKIFAGIVALILIISLFALLRRGQVGLLNLSSDLVIDLYSTGRLSISEAFRLLLLSLPGQEVFSNVVGSMQRFEFFHGSTYFQSFFGRILPIEFLGWERDLTPTFWYKNFFLSDNAYGRDFSMSAEAYMNFGIYGVFVFLLVGFALGVLSVQLRLSKDPVLIIWSALMIANIVISLRTDSNGFFARAMYSIIPLLLYAKFTSSARIIGTTDR